MIDSFAEHIGTLYRFCAQSLHYPSSLWFSDAYLDSLYHLLTELKADDERKEIEQAFSSAANPLEDLQIEHTRLFINGVPHVAAPPYGSVYLDRAIHGPHAEKTLHFYRQHGYDLKTDADLPDHIVNQLEFLALLAEKRDHAASQEFLSTVFLPWFPSFLTRVLQEARHPFYRVVVLLIDYLTKEDDEHGIQPDEA